MQRQQQHQKGKCQKEANTNRSKEIEEKIKTLLEKELLQTNPFVFSSVSLAESIYGLGIVQLLFYFIIFRLYLCVCVCHVISANTHI